MAPESGRRTVDLGEVEAASATIEEGPVLTEVHVRRVDGPQHVVPEVRFHAEIDAEASSASE